MKQFFLILSGLALLTGCSSKNDSVEGPVQSRIRIAPSISRVTGLNFDTGDRIGLTIVKSGANYCENTPLRFDGTVFVSDDLFWYDDSSEKSNLTAYYPYLAEGAPASFTVRADQKLAADIVEGEVDLVVLVVKNAQRTELVRHLAAFFFRVVRRNAQQDQKAPADLALELSVDRNGGVFNLSQYCSHDRFLSMPQRGGVLVPTAVGSAGQRGYSLLEENTPFVSPREGRGEFPSTPNIVSLQLEELHALRNQVRCTWLRHESLRVVTTLNRALLS